MLSKKLQATENKPIINTQETSKFLASGCDLSHAKAVELLETIDPQSVITTENPRWFVEIKAVDRITGEIKPLKVLL